MTLPRPPSPVSERLYFLKLGGSLITDKSRPHTHRPALLQRLAEEIATARAREPGLRILLGHGSGSFGHVPASRHGTREGVRTPEGWAGFIEVWREAAALNRLVMQALEGAGLPAIALPPSAQVAADRGKAVAWDTAALEAALQAGLLPVIYGDVVFDRTLGGTILSTEDLFYYLAHRLRPERLLLAGKEPGIWADFPQRAELLPEITPADLPGLVEALGGSADTDVTGGMAAKVGLMFELIQADPRLEALIFSGEQPGNLSRALSGELIGTVLHARSA